MAVTMADIQNLRKRTGAGMMDCKNALSESAGDIDKAIEIIRKKGQAFAAKRGDRDASEGCVIAKTNGNHATIVALKCETDFVAINSEFIELTTSILEAASTNKSANIAALGDVKIGDRTITDLVTDRMGITGEKMELGACEQITAPAVVAYIHPGNKLATIVGFNKTSVDPQMARDIAMQIAAMNPIALTPDEVSQEIRDKEMDVAREKARAENKPENILERIAEGALNKYFKDNTLLQQDFVKNPKQTIAQYIAASDKDLAITEFKRFTLNAE